MQFLGGNHINLSKNRRGVGFGLQPGYVFDSSSVAYFATMVVQPPDAVKIIIDEFIRGCKADVSLRTGTPTSNWDEIYALWIWMLHTRQAAYLNARYPSMTPASDGVQPDFIPFQGVQGDGATTYINLNWNPTTAVAGGGATFSQNDAGIFVYGESDLGVTAIAMGAVNGSNQGCSINPRTATDVMSGAISGANANIGTAGSTTSSLGFKSIRRDNSTQMKTNKGAASDSNTTSATSIAPLNLDMKFLARNSNGTVNNFDSRKYSLAGITSGFVDSYKLSLRIETLRS
jgi:hypothetical protein